jgi:hypothetical protein
MGQGRIKNIDEYIKESLINIRDDRAVTSTLLTELLMEMKKAGDLETHKQLGLIASKYVETLQRSNEQLVKITAILSKKREGAAELDESDKQELFDLIQGEK